MRGFDKCLILLFIFTISLIILSKLPDVEGMQIVHIVDGSGMEIHQ